MSALPARALAQSAPTILRVGVIPSEVCGQMFYGVSEGFFKKNGLDVQLEFFKNGAEITAALAGGALDVGLSDLSSAILAHSRGIPVTYVAPGLMYTDKMPTFAIIVSGDSPIRLQGREGRIQTAPQPLPMRSIGAREFCISV